MTGNALPFDEAIAFLRSKVRLPSRAWTDIKEGAHARSFVVAGATTSALVEDFHAAVLKAVAAGATKADFLKDFDRIVAAHGWDYKGGRGWRAGVIYNTNLRAAGRWDQFERTRDTRPYLRYSAILDGRTRPLHRKWHGIILPMDDPWWKTHFPPNGWNCRCGVHSVSEADLARNGWVVSASPETFLQDRQVKLADGSTENWPTPEGIDTGFGYNPGKAGWLAGGVPPPLREPLPAYGAAAPPADLPPLPSPHPADPADILPAGLTDEAYANAFLSAFGGGVGRSVGYRDAAGHLLALSDELFKTRQGAWKIQQQGRERFLPVLAKALRNPDEIWLDWAKDDKGNPVLRRRYLTALELPRLSKEAKGNGLIAALEWTDKGWAGVTLFQARTSTVLDKQRVGVLLYRRG